MRKLSISITIIIILILLLVILIVGINRNRPCGGLNDTCFIPHSKGIDFEVAISECQSRCERAKALPDNLRHRHSYCTSSFSIDFDKDNEPDTILVNNTKSSIRFYCDINSATLKYDQGIEEKMHLGYECEGVICNA